MYHVFCLCSQLHEKSLLEANAAFLEKHKGHILPDLICMPGFTSTKLELECYVYLHILLSSDSLMHRAAVAEMMSLLEFNKKAEAIKLIEDSNNHLASTYCFLT